MPRMTRLTRILAVVALGLALLAVVAVLGLRSTAGRHGPVEAVAGTSGAWRVRNAFVDLYAVRADDGVLLFDAGADVRGRGLDALLAAAGSNRDGVRALFLTHGHFDHIAGVPLVAGAAVYAGAADAALLRGQGGKSALVTGLLARIFRVPPLAVPAVLHRRLDVLVSGGRERVVAIPFAGHTAGSFVYLFRGVLYAGDALELRDGILVPPSPGMCEDPAAARRAIAALPALLRGAEVTTICTGHGGCTPPAATATLLADLVRRAGR
jgi:glyoxylase-like metal-dependent hydrolase (beta-lactamase superfamily II)